MTSSTLSHPPKDLRPLSRYITTHAPNSTTATFSTAIPSLAPVQAVFNNNIDFTLMYTTDSHPVKMYQDQDIKSYAEHITNPPGLVISSGSVCRVCDYPPGYTTPMHRSVSLDFGVVLEGEIELVLDSGETRVLRRGDVAVQRGTNHAWRNVTPEVDGHGKWARMLYVLQGAESLTLGDGLGKLDEYYGQGDEMEGVPRSK